MRQWIGHALARYLTAPGRTATIGYPTDNALLAACVRPGDVILVDGDSRVSAVIKYLTQSTWSHAALYVGEQLAKAGGNPDHHFVEADTVEGVRSVGVDVFEHLHTRICRPIGLTDGDRERVIAYAIARLGSQYDLRNIIDLARYLLPTPPVPTRFRRRMLALGSGDPTRAICSTLIAQAFQSIRYPILPITDLVSSARPDCPECVEEILRVRHHSLFAPRDFDVSPYFQVLKPAISEDFDFHALRWGEVAEHPQD